MDTKGLQKEFINWCKSKNKQPKSEDETKQLFIAFMKEKHPEEYKKAVENQQKQQQAQAQKALHGAKLNYFRTLKNQCAEDEEVVYYKKGGSVNCGCKKKEEGGEVKKDCGGSAIAKFKKMKSGKKITIKPQPQVNPSDTVHVNGIAYSVTNSDGSPVDNRFKPYSGKVEEEDRKKAKKGDKDAQKRQLKQELASSEKCGGKVKKHQEGSVIAKFKAYRKGGSLNGIPFYQGGTPEGGITRSINGEYYTMPIPYGAGNGPAGQGPLYLLEAKVTGMDNPFLITGEAPGPTKAKSAWEALQMVKAMKAAKNPKAARQIVLANKPTKINTPTPTSTPVSQPKRIKASHGYTTELEIPNIPNYQELYDSYKMTKASRLNMNNILEKLPPEERANVLKVIMGDANKYLNVLGNITPAKASGIIRGIRKRIPGEYTPLRVQSLDQTKPSMRSGMLGGVEDATSHTAGFKRTTNKY